MGEEAVALVASEKISKSVHGLQCPVKSSDIACTASSDSAI